MKQDIKGFITRSCSWTLAAIMTFAAGGCHDEMLYSNENGPEGEPAILTLSMNLPEREEYTRAALDATNDNRVNSLWIGIYNKESGDCKTNLYINSANGSQYGFKGNSGTHTDMSLSIPTVSGDSYIVAVANPEGHKGIKLGNASESDLLSLLENATTWTDYKSISVSLAQSAGGTEYANVQTPAVNENQGLVMSGAFVNKDSESHGDIWTNELLNQTVYINPGATTINGRVHLRRLMSHITFNLQAEGNVVNIEPLGYQIKNAPMYSWVHERTNYGNYGQTEGTIIEATNAGDALSPVYLDNKNYKPSLSFTATDFIKNGTGASTIYSFDFWMMENKRQGLASCDAYSKREAEYGGSIGNLTYPRPTEDTNYVPSGVFVSLTDKEVTLNNMATYVDIPCIVTYRNPTTDNDSGATDAEATDVIPSGATRTANVTYRVHLGYTGGRNADPKDFNSYRNSSYTYNVQ